MGKENESDGTKKRRKSVNASGGTSMKDGDMYKVYKNYNYLLIIIKNQRIVTKYVVFASMYYM